MAARFCSNRASVLARSAVFLACLCTIVLAPASPTPRPSHLANISTRLNVGVDDDVLIGGFIVRGPDPKKMILRAIGPSLIGAGVVGAMVNPTLELHDSTGAMIAANDDWQTSAQAGEISASGLAPTNPLESAILATLQPGNYTAIVRGVNNTTGIALVEGYELDSTATRLVNVSTRGQVGVGDDVLIGGFIVTGSDSKTVIVRALGPSLGTGAHPLTGVLANPVLELHDGSGNLLSSNDDWVNSPQQSAIVASGLAPSNSLESAILTTLSPGNYTAIVRGANNTTGIGLVEVYDLDPTSTREVWIAVRTDGVAGSGTQDDPYDGSTQSKFDSIMPAVAEDTTIHLGAGIFITNGATQMKEGWRVAGLGKDITTIKLADNVLTSEVTNACVIQRRDFVGFLNYFELSDLTIDCNKVNQSAYTQNLSGHTLNAWFIQAKSARITNVKAIGTWANPGEGFPCNVEHDGTRGNGDSIQISGCDNINPEGYLTAISVFDQRGGLISGFIENCTVTDHPGGGAFGAGGWQNFEVRNNYTRNVSIPILIDTHDYYNVNIWGNRFYASIGYTILFNGGGAYQGINIYNNIFDHASNGAALFTGTANVSTQIYGNSIFMNNAQWMAFSFGANTSGSVHDNVVQENHATSDLSGCPLLNVYNNRDASGNPITLGR